MINKFIEDLNNKITLATIILDHDVRLEPFGKAYLKGFCPFCEDQPLCERCKKRNSFVVSVPQKSFYCFGCHIGGNAIDFIRNFHKIDEEKACEYLKSKYESRLSGD